LGESTQSDLVFFLTAEEIKFYIGLRSGYAW